MNVSLTDAVLAFYFIPWGTDASERPLQILTGTRRTRARKGNTLISILKRNERKKWFKYEELVARWSTRSLWTNMCWESLLTSWVLLLWQEANFLALFPLPVFAETWTASSSVPVKQCNKSFPMVGFYLKEYFPLYLNLVMWSDNQIKCKRVFKWGLRRSHINILWNETT